jgi:hypothetical protein
MEPPERGGVSRDRRDLSVHLASGGDLDTEELAAASIKAARYVVLRRY